MFESHRAMGVRAVKQGKRVQQVSRAVRGRAVRQGQSSRAARGRQVRQ